MTCEAVHNGERSCTNQARLVSIFCLACGRRFGFMLCNDHLMSLRYASDGAPFLDHEDCRRDTDATIIGGDA